MLFEHAGEYEPRWGATGSIVAKIGWTTETPRNRARQTERDSGQRPGLTTRERERLKQLEREVKELRRANEIPRKASAFFPQAEPGRQWK